VHHDTAEHFSDAGFVVAALNHPGDTALGNSLFYDLSIYMQRPLGVKRAIDYLIGASPLATTIDPNRIGIGEAIRPFSPSAPILTFRPCYHCAMADGQDL
jgi:predicted dienelactone hydrolase